MTDPPGHIRYPWTDPPAGATATEVAEGVHWLRLPLPMKLDHVNVYALEDGDAWTLVDTGFDTERAHAIWDRILAGPLAGKPVGRVVLTHHHPDHVGLAGWFAAAHGAELWATRTAWLTARMLTLDVQTRPPPETLAFWRAAGMPADRLARLADERPFNFADVVAPLPQGFRRMTEGTAMRAGGRDWDVRLGAGHAAGHATLWSRDGALVLGGDQLLPRISPNISVRASEPEADPVADWLEASERLAAHADDARLVLPGHKLPYRGLPERLRQLVAGHRGELARLEAALVRPHTAVDCFPVLFKRAIGEGEYHLALGEAVAHLNHLHHAGRVRRWRDAEGAWLWQAARVWCS